MKLEWGKTADKQMNWQEAIDYYEKLGDGWRLPTIQELVGYINYNKYNPASDMDFKTDDYYWSSTTNAYGTDYAWGVHFRLGSVDDSCKTDSYYVRPVRDILKGGN